MVTCKFKIAPGVRRVIWAITNNCNYACKYCIFNSGPKYPVAPLDYNQVELILKNLKALGFNYIKYTGGEPFARPDIMSILRLTNMMGFQFDISTNASLITDGTAAELSKLTNLQYVHVGIDGYDKKTQEDIRGKDSFIPTVIGIVRLTDNHVRVRSGCVVTSLNEHDLHNIIDLNMELGVRNIAFSLLEPVGRLSSKELFLPKRTKESLIADIQLLQKQSTLHITENFSDTSDYKLDKCPAGKDFIHIDANGIITPCPWVSEYTSAYNIKYTELDRLPSLNKDLHNCPVCPALTKEHAIRWLNIKK